jgi:SpoVK/Ycf46/Vps4 family AAA+-type ATPase
LHQIIIGPPGTGKKYEANNYAKKLLQAGIVKDECLVFDGGAVGNSTLTLREVMHIFDRYKDGVVIIDDAYLYMTTLNNSLQNLIDGIVGSIREGSGPIFILTGDDREMEKFLSQNPALRDALPPPVYTKSRLQAEAKTLLPSGPKN